MRELKRVEHRSALHDGYEAGEKTTAFAVKPDVCADRNAWGEVNGQ